MSRIPFLVFSVRSSFALSRRHLPTIVLSSLTILGFLTVDDKAISMSFCDSFWLLRLHIVFALLKQTLMELSLLIIS